jgi:hypothetical protein
MNLDFISLQSNASLGNGYVTLRFRNAAGLEAANQCSIQRIGHQMSNLGAHQWQGSIYLFNLFGVDQTTDEYCFVLEPWAVSHLTPSSNYKITLYDSSSAEIGHTILHWRGVPNFRLPSGSREGPLTPSKSPVEPEAAISEINPTNLEKTRPTTVELPPVTLAEPAPAATNTHAALEPSTLGPARPIPCPHDPTHKIYSNVVFCPICSKPV